MPDEKSGESGNTPVHQDNDPSDPQEEEKKEGHNAASFLEASGRQCNFSIQS